MHSSCVWDTETAQFNRVLRELPAGHLAAPVSPGFGCMGGTDVDRRLSRAGSGAAGCALPGLTCPCRWAALRPGQVSLCGTATLCRARLELKPSFSLRGVDSPARDAEDPWLTFRYHWHSRNLLLTPQDRKFLL